MSVEVKLHRFCTTIHMTAVDIWLDLVLLFLQRDKCPQFENLEPSLIPVGFKTPITFKGKNLEKYMVMTLMCSYSLVRWNGVSHCHNLHFSSLIFFFFQGKMFQIGTELMKQVGDVNPMGPKFSFEGYKVSMSKYRFYIYPLKVMENLAYEICSIAAVVVHASIYTSSCLTTVIQLCILLSFSLKLNFTLHHSGPGQFK